MSDGYSISKKSDDFCGNACGQMSRSARLRCFLRGIDWKIFFLIFLITPIGLTGTYFQYPKISAFVKLFWEHPQKPFTFIPHYYNSHVPMENLCKLHGWSIREYPRRVYDAALFNNEIDMLTIRWKELYPYITQFVLLESNSTFTGIPKPHFFQKNRENFDFVNSRLTYGTIGGRFKKGENPFVEEAYQRLALDQLLKFAGIQEDDLLIMSDVDEIPSGHTIDLLRWCDNIPPVIHLDLRNYMYSFEFMRDHRSWRASVHRYQMGKTRYAHYRQSDFLLADAGWHCSFCFKKISDFVFKMKAYSHNDRIRFSHFLDPKRIQDKICNGENLYDMLWGEHTFKDMMLNLGPIPHYYSAVHLPAYLLNNAENYKYLLPGNCMRESS